MDHHDGACIVGREGLDPGRGVALDVRHAGLRAHTRVVLGHLPDRDALVLQGLPVALGESLDRADRHVRVEQAGLVPVPVQLGEQLAVAEVEPRLQEHDDGVVRPVETLGSVLDLHRPQLEQVAGVVQVVRLDGLEQGRREGGGETRGGRADRSHGWGSRKGRAGERPLAELIDRRGTQRAEKRPLGGRNPAFRPCGHPRAHRRGSAPSSRCRSAPTRGGSRRYARWRRSARPGGRTPRA